MKQFHKSWQLFICKSKNIWYGIVVLAFFSVCICFFKYNEESINGIFKGCAIDGPLSWTVSRQSLAGIILPIAMMMTLITIEHDFRVIYIISCRTRRKLFNQQIMTGLYISAIALFSSMIVSFLMAFIFEGQLYNWDTKFSLYFFSTGEEGVISDLIWQIPYIYLINFAKVFCIVFLGILIYWFFASKTIVMVMVLMYSLLEAFAARGNAWKYSNLLFDKISSRVMYKELIDISVVGFNVLLVLGICIVIWSASFLIVKRKEFSKNV